MLTVISYSYGELKALSLLSATHFTPQTGGPLICAPRARTIGPLHYRSVGKEVKNFSANKELFRLVSFRIYFLFGISSFTSLKFLILTHPSLFYPKLQVRDLKLPPVWKEPSEMGRCWKTGMGSTGKEQGKLCSRASLYCVVIAQGLKTKKMRSMASVFLWSPS